MIKVLLFFFLITTVYADDEQKASGILNMIIQNITQKENATIYLHTELKSLELYPRKLKIVDNCSEAEIVIISSNRDIPKDCDEKILFATRYAHLKNPNVVGAFFWQKGRPNILFYQERLSRYSIQLDSSFNKYIDD